MFARRAPMSVLLSTQAAVGCIVASGTGRA